MRRMTQLRGESIFLTSDGEPAPLPDQTPAANEAAAVTPLTADSIELAVRLTRDIDPAATDLGIWIADPSTPLVALRAAKDAYKTLRVSGPDPNARRLGGRLYVAVIAAAFVHHGACITGQTPAALDHGFEALIDDVAMPFAVREIAVRSLFRLRAGRLPREPIA